MATSFNSENKNLIPHENLFDKTDKENRLNKNNDLNVRYRERKFFKIINVKGFELPA